MLIFAIWWAQVFETHVILLLAGTLSGVDLQDSRIFFVAGSLLDSLLIQNIFQHFDLTIEPIDLFAIFIYEWFFDWCF